MSSINFVKEDTLYNYDGVVGKALLERRTGVNGSCNQYDSLWSCSVMDCLYCENCYYKITLENGEAISNTIVDLNIVENNSWGFEDDDYEILFYDYVPKIDDLFSYLFDEKSQFRVVRISDHIVMNDYVKTSKRLVKI